MKKQLQFTKEPFPLRFETLENAQSFQESYVNRTPDISLAVPPFIKENGAGKINPKWEEARYEWTLILNEDFKSGHSVIHPPLRRL